MSDFKGKEETLIEAGINPRIARRYEQFAELPEEEREAYFENTNASGGGYFAIDNRFGNVGRVS